MVGGPGEGELAARDAEYMRIALALAARGLGRTSPNPVVGCVIVSPDGVVVGTGYHERAGGPHAEVRALAAAGRRSAGATLYVTLEPCCHTGRTGPCVVPIVEAGIARVVAAARDPHPRVAGGGFAYLRAHGLAVTEGVGRAEARRLNAPFFTAVTRGRPHVTLKIATSLDGRVAAGAGQRTPLTGPEADRATQLLRAECDAIGVGSETLLVDDPALTVRDVFRERPFVRVVFDRRLRTPATARVLQTTDQGPVWVCTTAAAVAAHPGDAEALGTAGAEVIATAGSELDEVLGVLGRREVRSLLVEGGPTLHAAAWRARAVDRLRILVAPRVLGPSGIPWSMPADCHLPAIITRVEPVGADVLLEGDVHWTR
jgi:diaminohydroxyphosphoribosylaminopyrimidine deaminase/5-amino-6-(5-phosphoribosylamino)uracil reductase